jgi:spore coat protein U-like protein
VVDASSNLSVECTLNGAYTVALDGGTITGNVNDRKMELGVNSIDYQLYRDPARTLVWGNTVGTTVGGTGSGAAQSLAVYGRVPAQGAKPPGTYQDTITATVTF